MKMKKYIYGLWIMLAAVIFAACQDEIEQTGSNVKEGLPAKLKLSIKVPSADKVVSSRGIYDYESEVKELALIMFEKSGRKVFLDLTGKLTHKAYTQNGTETDALTDTGGRIYTLSEDIEGDDLSGDYTLYAIANWSSPFCGLTTERLQAMTESELNSALAANTNFVTQITGDDRLPMTYKSEETVAIKPLSEDTEGTELSISLRRITSHIIFEFKNGSGGKLEEENVKFVPTSYTVYNLPKNANLICKGNSEEGLNILTSNDYSNSASIATTGTSLEFFMLENVQENKKITAYADRDKWEGTNEDETKIFTNAPSGATYIVVKGEYISDKYFGEVSYTIHLGNFGEKSYSNSQPGNGNFTVNRNEKHTYTVTVIGVNSIVTEVTNQQEEQPGPEGTISKISEGSNFVLDAHYETIMLKFPKDAKLGRSIIAVKTPFDNDTYTSDQTGGDYNWVHFMKPESTSAFPNYSTESACDIKEFAQELLTLSQNGTNSNPHYKEVEEDDGITYLYTAVFVDEYFYSDKDWPKFVDQDNRIIILNPEAKTSVDGNSTYNADYIFQIAQRSIKTTYTHDGSINAFGIETWNETGRGQFDPNSLSGTVTEDSDGNYKSFGYQNTTTLLGTSWSVNKTTAGYFTSPSTNSENDHYFSGVVTKDDNGDITAFNEVYNGYNACLTRNRDENGNGTIDSEELKWYLPALEQYTTIWMGRDKLLGDTQLFSNEKMDDLSNTENNLYYWNKVNLWTSSPNNYKVYWPAEGASYGKNGESLGIRCVRKGHIAEITSIDKINDRIIKVNGASELSMRRTSMTGEYAEHTERSDENKLYSAFEVAKYVIGQTTEAETRYFYEDTEDYLLGYCVRLKAVNSDNTEYEFAIQVTTDGEISFYTAEGPENGTSLSASTTTDAVRKTMTCTADNGVSIVISTERTSSEEVYRYNGWGKVTLSVEKQDGYTYYFNGAAAAMTNLVTVTSDAGDVTYFTVDDIKGNNLCAANYSQEEDQSDLGQWRVPNQRELMLMVQYDFMPNASSSFAYASRTFFTKATELSKPYSFTYIGHITLQPDTDSFVIRCVRDAISTSGQSTLNYLSGQSGSSYGAGSSLF